MTNDIDQFSDGGLQVAPRFISTGRVRRTGVRLIGRKHSDELSREVQESEHGYQIREGFIAGGGDCSTSGTDCNDQDSGTAANRLSKEGGFVHMHLQRCHPDKSSTLSTGLLSRERSLSLPTYSNETWRSLSLAFLRACITRPGCQYGRYLNPHTEHHEEAGPDGK